jgi:phosphate transport system permease protein
LIDEAATTFAGEEVPLRPTTWHLSDAVMIVGSALSALAVVWLVYIQLLGATSPAVFFAMSAGLFLTLYWVTVRERDGRLAAKDRIAAVLVTGGALALLVPLVLIVGFMVAKGISALSPHFFTRTEQGTGPLDPASAGGAFHAIVGTLEEVAIAALISVPLGILTAVFLNEVGGRMARPVRMLVDAMSGVPSIVAGLFIYTVWVVGLGKGFSGIAAGFALSILMLPTVTRTVEEVLRIVPDGLREASLALGAPEWRTALGVVLPTARSGVVTGTILGIARGVGETAPLIVTALGAKLMNANPLHGAQASLPLFVWANIRGTATELQRAYAGALVLIMVVLALFVTARVIGARSLAGGRRGRRSRGDR